MRHQAELTAGAEEIEESANAKETHKHCYEAIVEALTTILEILN